MTTFQYKTYRCEWQIRFVETDQYGQDECVYKRIPYPTYEEATAALPDVAVESPDVKGRWHPKETPHSTYRVAKVVYSEVEI